MATATSNVKRTELSGDITLILSPAEAVFLASLLDETVGDSTSKNDPESISSSIYYALMEAYVPKVDGGFTGVPIRFTGPAMNKLNRALADWNP